MTQIARHPMPVIVGSPRSGTTLLRLMLDAHSQLAIPPETGFLGLGPALIEGSLAPHENFVRSLMNFPPDMPAWRDYGIDASQLESALAALDPFTVSDGLRAFYSLYAARFCKCRFGDKTPMHCRQLRQIQTILPEAHFIHIIRDGRDVAVSLRKRWFSPGRDIATQALFWRDNVVSARAQGADCEHYLEVHYENLLRHTESELRRICAFVELQFEPRQLDYYETAPQRLAEHRERMRLDGSLVVSHEERLKQQAGTRRPPDKTRIGVWKTALTSQEKTDFNRVAGDALDQFGYALEEMADA